MKTKKKLTELETNGMVVPRIRTLDFRLGVTERGLEQAIKRSFNMAKSAGRELDVLFTAKSF